MKLGLRVYGKQALQMQVLKDISDGFLHGQYSACRRANLRAGAFSQSCWSEGTVGVAPLLDSCLLDFSRGLLGVKQSQDGCFPSSYCEECPFSFGRHHLLSAKPWPERWPLVELLVLHGRAARAELLGAAMSSRRPLISSVRDRNLVIPAADAQQSRRP